jgi:hypothetical protein
VPSAPTHAPASEDAEVVVPAARHRRRGGVLLALAVFQFWLWGTRIWNLAQEADRFSAAFVTVHAVLYVVAIGAGVVLAVLGSRMWREARTAGAGSGTRP